MDELGLFCDQHKPHVLAISETWLDDSFVDEEVSKKYHFKDIT